MFKKAKNKKGFTLIELIVVIAILAVLAAIIIPTVANNIERANDARDRANARSAYAEFTVQLLLIETIPTEAVALAAFLSSDIPGGTCDATLNVDGTVNTFVCTMDDGDTFSLQVDGQIEKD